MKVIFSTVPDMETAKQIARALVQKRAAACVNVVPGLLSIYEWKGNIEEEDELLLIIKSDSFDKVKSVIREMHPYEVPEIVAINMAEVDEKYLSWMQLVLVE
ncbi:divalent-cation tolerance protein CutA [Nitratiruptor sp. SB155-2]|uniref:divalent-cation tolerance protein CutA n=1 Tax=Nitratiruptor sp. (strain SB155-2) TaxID=387092 RepID=UPI000158734E|nr:divalent-cation tolerance protein CutA [Nitratiruptor sp. SB155-2]BAF70151.1 divalent cation tolerance protein [Nitratiruptor sp. SB155-2]